MTLVTTTVSAIKWQDNSLWLLDQGKLPTNEQWLCYQSATAVAEAIQQMVVRGAPAIGLAAAYGVVLALQCGHWGEALNHRISLLARSRPTAVNLQWALDTMKAGLEQYRSASEALPVALALAQKIHQDDQLASQQMAHWGAECIAEQGRCHGILTHCNAGALATGGVGTALGVVRAAWSQRLVTKVFAGETRPWWQGARLTSWELLQDGIPVALIADSGAAALMQQGKVQWLIVGADRVAANGDVANKIGTYGLAVLARYHGVKVMVVAPCSTLDFAVASGADIPIEERPTSELTMLGGAMLAPPNASAFNPVFDVTPATLVDVLVTEKGAIQRPDSKALSQWR